MTIRAILFDLDNTLYPESSGVMQLIDRRIGDYVQQRLGLPEDEATVIRHHLYTTYGTTLRGLQQHYAHLQTDTEEYLRFVHDVAIEELLTLDHELDQALTQIDAQKVIFTNSPREHADRVLRAMGLAHHFERVFDLRYFNFVGKPDPFCYQHILDELGVDGSQALLLEDTAVNLAPAKALGMQTILITPVPAECATADFQAPDTLAALRIAAMLTAPAVSIMPPAAVPRSRTNVRRSA